MNSFKYIKKKEITGDIAFVYETENINNVIGNYNVFVGVYEIISKTTPKEYAIAFCTLDCDLNEHYIGVIRDLSYYSLNHILKGMHIICRVFNKFQNV